MPNPIDKTTAWTPLDTGDPAREHHLAQAYLLCQRRQYDEARRLLNMLLVSYPTDPDARYLLGRINSTEQVEERSEQKLRSWRYTLGLQTAWARFVAYVGALAALIYGGWNVSVAFGEAREHGFGGLVTTW